MHVVPLAGCSKHVTGLWRTHGQQDTLSFCVHTALHAQGGTYGRQKNSPAVGILRNDTDVAAQVGALDAKVDALDAKLGRLLALLDKNVEMAL